MTFVRSRSMADFAFETSFIFTCISKPSLCLIGLEE